VTHGLRIGRAPPGGARRAVRASDRHRPIISGPNAPRMPQMPRAGSRATANSFHGEGKVFLFPASWPRSASLVVVPRFVFYLNISMG